MVSLISLFSLFTLKGSYGINVQMSRFFSYLNKPHFFLTEIFLFLGILQGHAQCTNPDFTLPASVCMNEKVYLTTSSVSGESYDWDFCEGDLVNTPVAQSVIQVNEAGALTGIHLVSDSGNYYMFITGRTGNNLIRIDLGTNPNNPSPTRVNLGNLGGVLTAPIGIKLIKEQGQWYGIIYNSGNDNLVRVSFGTSLENNSPSAQNVVKAYGSVNNGLDVGISNGKVVVAVTNATTNKLTLIDFGNSILNTPVDPTNIITTAAFSGASALRGMTLLRGCDKWYGYAVAAGNRKIYRMDFNANLYSAPVVTDITGTFAGTENFVDIKVFYDAGVYVGFIMTTQRVVYRLDFGNSLANLPTKTSLGNLAISAGTFLFFDFIRHNSTWHFFAGKNDPSYIIYRADFPNICGASPASYSGNEPGRISFSTQGTYQLTVKATTATGGINYRTKSLSVLNKSAPDITLNHDGVCVSSATQFSVISDSILTSAMWSFGDSTIASGQDTVHFYTTTGTYLVQVDVEAQNGCKNYAYDQIKIYNTPAPDFTLPSGVICTNNDYLFENTTIDDFDSLLSYQWEIDNIPVDTTRNLEMSFAVAGSKTIKLITAIPGCSTEISKVLPSVNEGPTVDFTYAGSCQDEPVSFNSTITGDVSAVAWDFGDSQSSTEADPIHSYSSPGNFTINLETSSTNGCQNTISKPITIYSQPQPDFTMALPPFSCNGTPTQFNDNTPNPTDSNITLWSWDFGDPGSAGNTSADQDAIHTFAEAGDYTITLTVTTNFNCSNTVQTVKTISQTPVADFSYTPPCVETPVTFDDAGNNISSWHWQIANTHFYSARPVYTFLSPGDYNVSLTVSGDNNCTSYIQKTLNVPQVISPDFSVLKNCAGQPAEFTDETVESADPVASREWTFENSGSATGSTASFVFPSPGDHEVTLDVTTQTGCVYSTTKAITIFETPDATFTANPESGTPPLTVTFTGESTTASQYLWTFGGEGDTITPGNSMQTTFNDLGNYVIDLTVTDERNCSNTYSRIITLSRPVFNISLTSFIVNEDASGNIGAILTIKNQGNISVRNVNIALDIGGIEIKEVIPGPILPDATITYIPAFQIVKNDLIKYLCATVNVENETDSTDNELCASFAAAGTAIVFTPYPNPCIDKLSVEWITGDSQEANITILDALGHEKYSAVYASQAGFNTATLDVTGMTNGVYFLVIDAVTTHNTFRFMISH